MATSLPTRLVANAAGAGFGAIARLRHDRALHPKGVVLNATVTLRAVPGVPALEAPGEHRALLRSSKSLGLPDGVPDIWGLALRLCDLHGPDRHQDVLLASCPPPPAHLVLAPYLGPGSAWYTSLLPYRVGERRGVIVAHGDGGRRFRLGLTGYGRRPVEPLGEVVPGEPVASAVAEAIRFDPIVHDAPQLRQDAGALDVVRRRAYQGSRAGSQ